MKLIKPKFEILEQRPGISGIYRMIELAGRTCYRSEDKITPDSAVAFVDRMIKSGHGAMLEHGTVYLDIPQKANNCYTLISNYTINKYSVLNHSNVNHSQEHYYVTTNLRVLVENNWMDDLQYVCEPTEYHEKRITVRFTCDRGVSHEFVRHRVFSFAQESTRYCNYSKDKFGNELTFIIPCWADSLALQEVKGTIINHDEYGNLIGEYYYHLTGKEEPWFKPWEITPERNFIANLQISEQLYLELLNQGWRPQQARAVLPNSLKTELVMTGTIEQWEGFFKLRDAKDAHPQARELAQPLHEEFIKRGLIKA